MGWLAMALIRLARSMPSSRIITRDYIASQERAVAQGEFKHITVTPAEEEDFVINAGAASPSPTVADDSGDEPGADGAFGGEPGKEAASSRGDEGEARAAAAKVPANRKASGGGARKENGYREATLEDLESEPMSLTQKVVIIAAVVCIIGALAYYFAFLR